MEKHSKFIVEVLSGKGSSTRLSMEDISSDDSMRKAIVREIEKIVPDGVMTVPKAKSYIALFESVTLAMMSDGGENVTSILENAQLDRDLYGKLKIRVEEARKFLQEESKKLQEEEDKKADKAREVLSELSKEWLPKWNEFVNKNGNDINNLSDIDNMQKNILAFQLASRWNILKKTGYDKQFLKNNAHFKPFSKMLENEIKRLKKDGLLS